VDQVAEAAEAVDMKHAGPAELESVAGLLTQLRGLDSLGLVEKKPGVFYRRTRAFLHFHEDPSGMYVDVRTDPEGAFVRMRVTTAAEQARLMRVIRQAARATAHEKGKSTRAGVP
jgi:hypothetical protein